MTTVQRGVMRRATPVGVGDIASDLSNIVSTAEGDVTGFVTNTAGASISDAVLGPYKGWIIAIGIGVGFILVRDVYNASKGR